MTMMTRNDAAGVVGTPKPQPQRPPQPSSILRTRYYYDNYSYSERQQAKKQQDNKNNLTLTSCCSRKTTHGPHRFQRGVVSIASACGGKYFCRRTPASHRSHNVMPTTTTTTSRRPPLSSPPRTVHYITWSILLFSLASQAVLSFHYWNEIMGSILHQEVVAVTTMIMKKENNNNNDSRISIVANPSLSSSSSSTRRRIMSTANEDATFKMSVKYQSTNFSSLKSVDATTAIHSNNKSEGLAAIAAIQNNHKSEGLAAIPAIQNNHKSEGLAATAAMQNNHSDAIAAATAIHKNNSEDMAAKAAIHNNHSEDMAATTTATTSPSGTILDQAHRDENTTLSLHFTSPRLFSPTTTSSSSSIVFDSSFVFDSSTQCRLALEQYQNQKIDEWLAQGVPSLEDVFEYRGSLYILLGPLPGMDQSLLNGEWRCGQVSDNNISNTTMLTSHYITKRYDWRGHPVMRCPANLNVTHVWPSSSRQASNTTTSATTKKTVLPIYDTRPYQTCNDLDINEFKNKHKKRSRNKVKLGACAIIRGSYSRHYLLEWIAYHKVLGLEHFWVYVNEPWNTTGLPHLDYVTYVPFNFYLNDHILHANELHIHWQVPMQMKCLWNAKRLGLDWILTTDTDEYLDILDPNVNTTLSTSILPSSSSSVSPMSQFLSRFNPNKIGSLRIMSVPYGHHRQLEPLMNASLSSSSPSCLQMDQVWRHKDLRHVKGGWMRRKLIYSARTVVSVGVHYMWKCWHCSKNTAIAMKKPETSIYIRHYKSSSHTATGIYGNDDFQALVKDTRLVDLYRTAVWTLMNQTKVITSSSSSTTTTSPAAAAEALVHTDSLFNNHSTNATVHSSNSSIEQ